MGWDYYTFENQPVFFIEEIQIFMSQEAKKVDDTIRKAESKSKQKTGISR